LLQVQRIAQFLRNILFLLLILQQLVAIMELKGGHPMENLASIRKELHFTQQEIADYLGISRQAYSNYESGKREPDYETLLKLGEYFNCSIDYLLGSSRSVRHPILSEFERQLLMHYRAATPAIQSAVCKLLDLEQPADGTH
jgi:transcriptional regulator with XRE-family HTH domain